MFALNLLEQNRIVNGRLFVYEKDTTDLAPVFVLEGAEYVEAPNPIYYVQGVADNTYFLENRIYDCLAQEYTGESSDPKGDLRPSVWHDSFTTKVGFEFDKEQREAELTTVYTLANLKTLPVGGYVNVIGYWTETDCELRTYFWDETCVNTADDGLIVESEVSNTGRWLLIHNGVMKSEYYGVYGNSSGNPVGHEEHLAALFNYNDLYGTNSLTSPKIIVLASGLYGDGYTTYTAYGKKVIFQPGARFRVGNNLKCLTYEATGITGAVRVGYNKNGQLDVNYCSVPCRLSNYAKLTDFLQCNSTELIFDLEYDYDNPLSEGEKTHLNTIKTLTNVHCTFEKPFGFWTSAGEIAELTFDNCAIESDHKIRKSFGVHFKNSKVKDSWFYEPWDVYPNELDTGNEYLTNNFEYADSYITYKLNDCGSAVKLDCYGQKLHTHKTIGTSALSSVELNGLRTNEYGVTLSTPSATFHDCSFNSAYVYSPYVSAFDSRFYHGYLTANGLNSNNKVYRHYERCFFGGVDVNGNLKTRHNIESATYINLYVKDCNFENRHSPFISYNGCELGTNSLTYFYNNVGIGDGYCPTAFFNGENTRPLSIISGMLTWTDEVGNRNWRDGKTTYKMSPWPSDGQVHRFDGSLGAQFGYDDIGRTSSGVYCVLSSNFVRQYDNKVYNFMVQTFSANFKPYGPQGTNYTMQLYNPWNQDMGKVTLNKTERA